MTPYANEFSEIVSTLRLNAPLRGLMIALINEEQIAGKVTQGGNRTQLLRRILTETTTGLLSIGEAVFRVNQDLPPGTSMHPYDKRVFPTGWDSRLIRTQFSRFYSQTVLGELLAKGDAECFVPHSSMEKDDSRCSREMAGRKHSTKTLYNALVRSYADGNWSSDPMIPDHPHCTHVVVPLDWKSGKTTRVLPSVE